MLWTLHSCRTYMTLARPSLQQHVLDSWMPFLPVYFCVTVKALHLCLSCYVLSCSHEHGEYFSIDFGGTNLRLLYTKLSREAKVVVSPLSHATVSCCMLTCRVMPASHCLRLSVLREVSASLISGMSCVQAPLCILHFIMSCI